MQIYNKKKHLELVKRLLDLRNKKIFFHENPKEFLELSTRGDAKYVLMQAAQVIEHKMQRVVNLKNYKIVVDGQITSRELLRHFQQYDSAITSRHIIQNMFYQHTLRRSSTFNYYAEDLSFLFENVINYFLFF